MTSLGVISQEKNDPPAGKGLRFDGARALGSRDEGAGVAPGRGQDSGPCVESHHIAEPEASAELAAQEGGAANPACLPEKSGTELAVSMAMASQRHASAHGTPRTNVRGTRAPSMPLMGQRRPIPTSSMASSGPSRFVAPGARGADCSRRPTIWPARRPHSTPPATQTYTSVGPLVCSSPRHPSGDR